MMRQFPFVLYTHSVGPDLPVSWAFGGQKGKLMRMNVRSLRLRIGIIVCCGLLLGVGTSSGSSIPLYGISTNGSASAESDAGQSWNNGGFQQVLSFNQPLLTDSNSQTFDGLSGPVQPR